MKYLTDDEKIRFRRWIKENWKDLVEDISIESNVEKEKVLKVLDSLRCYRLFTLKDKDESCISSDAKMRRRKLKKFLY